jgi:hypothetical protein
MGNHQLFEFTLDVDLRKRVSVLRFGRSVHVTVAFTTDVLLDEMRAHIRNAIDPEMRTDELGLIIAWKQPIVPGWDWLMFSRQKRF